MRIPFLTYLSHHGTAISNSYIYVASMCLCSLGLCPPFTCLTKYMSALRHCHGGSERYLDVSIEAILDIDSPEQRPEAHN
ncbi:hypothetical protein HS1genome_1133 [Sulfodiicoccus acidiphilus]|uniref:Uncharacterized protein n=1 Tax=Sulfodiicoccus acidiphilus TaxID=1670455 RepID=A0A348B3J2_9CREN|nr:hypothetical protein HS1genome_1133 [Sulfodiicoccus acidiphilus]GGT95124.1 hypothetical protein GCM10007116_10740 [Sulfodiicoccus acidiphilus]